MRIIRILLIVVLAAVLGVVVAVLTAFGVTEIGVHLTIPGETDIEGRGIVGSLIFLMVGAPIGFIVGTQFGLLIAFLANRFLPRPAQAAVLENQTSLDDADFALQSHDTVPLLPDRKQIRRAKIMTALASLVWLSVNTLMVVIFRFPGFVNVIFFNVVLLNVALILIPWIKRRGGKKLLTLYLFAAVLPPAGTLTFIFWSILAEMGSH